MRAPGSADRAAGRRALVGLLALAALLAGPARGDEEPERVVERARVRFERVAKHHLQHRLRADQPPVEQRREVTLEVVFVRARTSREQYELHFERWRRREGQRTDLSLEGRRVRFARKEERDPALRPEIVEAPDAGPLSQAAQRYLEGLALELRRPLLDLVLPRHAGADAPPPGPKGRVSGEGPWELEGEGLRARLVPDAKLDAAHSKVEARATARPADGPWKLEVRGLLQLTTFPGSTARVTDGGAWRLRLEATWPAEAPPRLASRRHEATFEGVAADLRPDGTPVQLRVKAREEESLTVEPLPPG